MKEDELRLHRRNLPTLMRALAEDLESDDQAAAANDCRLAADEIETFWRLDREAATHVETVICTRTGFTGDEPYVGWKGLGLALTEALDERDRLRGLAGKP